MRSAYELARLAFADVVVYQRILDELRQSRTYRRMSYDVARQAILGYHSTGDLPSLVNVVSALNEETSNTLSPEAAVEPRNNAEVLAAYCNYFAVPYRPLSGFAIPGEFDSFYLDVAGTMVSGKPHLAVVNRSGTTKFLYILTSSQLTPEEKRLFIGLLSDIVSANVPSASPRDVEGLDCRTGQRIICHNGLGTRYLQRIQYVIQHLAACRT